MKTILKYSNKFAFALALCAMILSGCSCSAPKPAPDPLAGWQKEYTPKPSDKIIEKDYQDYIRNLPPEDQKYASVDGYYEDGKGQHAIKIEVDVNGTDAWCHILIYDKDNKRIKVVKYYKGRYQS